MSVTLYDRNGELVFQGTQTGGGGTTAGAARVLGPFPFAYNTAGINNGLTIWTPAVGDILLDAWVEVDTSFNGTTPQADIGQFNGVTYGIFGGIFGTGQQLLDVDSETGIGPGLLNASLANRCSAILSGVVTASTDLERTVPAKFTSTAPVKVVVSQNGLKGGTAVGGSAGAGAIYLVVSTPSLT